MSLEINRTIIYESRFGFGQLLFSGKNLVRHYLPGTMQDQDFKQGTCSSEESLVLKLQTYFDGGRIDFKRQELALDWSRWSAFERAVAERLLAVGYGEITTYAGLAIAAGYPNAHRAVGNFMAKNTLPLLLPCHRVIRSDGHMGGFSGGNGWKQRMLRLEGN